MPAKNWRGKSHPGLVWRVLFGNNGPTKGELRKLLGLTFSKTFDVHVRDPATGRVRKQRMRIGDDGRIQEVKAPAKQRSTAKRTAAKKTTARRGGSQPSKPSRASKTGSTPRQRQTAATPRAPRRARAEPLADRVLRNPDGTLAGSRSANPAKQLRKAEEAYLRASQHAEELLGWQQPPSR